MARKPTVGGDRNAWGTVLNEKLDAMDMATAANTAAVARVDPGSTARPLPGHTLMIDDTGEPYWGRPYDHLLTWAPPVLESPNIINVPATSGTTWIDMGTYMADADDNQDFLIVMPSSKKTGRVMIYTNSVKKARHIVIIGGHLTAGAGIDKPLTVQDWVGTLHIEGMLIDASGGVSDYDGIVLHPLTSAGNYVGHTPIAQIQNCRITGVTGTSGGFHGDIVQMWSNTNIRIDKLTGESEYQGLMLAPDQIDTGAELPRFDLRRVNLRYGNPSTATWTYLLWLHQATDDTMPTGVNLDAVYIEPRDGQTLDNAVMPNSGEAASIAASVTDGYLTFPEALGYTGGVTEGAPPDGDFVPESVPGLDYESPGYR